MNLVAQSFAWPFRGRWQARWAIGALAVLLLPLAFIPLLGYAVSATRAAAKNPAEGPPPWRATARLASDGFWTALVLLLLTAPFALALGPLAGVIDSLGPWKASAGLHQVYAAVAAAFILALPWGIVLLLLMPHATRRFASTGRPQDLFDFPAAIRDVRDDFPTWNVAAAAMVTAWAAGAACICLFCIGVVPGIFYAILVSAHAAAALHAKSEDPPAR